MGAGSLQAVSISSGNQSFTTPSPPSSGGRAAPGDRTGGSFHFLDFILAALSESCEATCQHLLPVESVGAANMPIDGVHGSGRPEFISNQPAQFLLPSKSRRAEQMKVGVKESTFSGMVSQQFLFRMHPANCWSIRERPSVSKLHETKGLSELQTYFKS